MREQQLNGQEQVVKADEVSLADASMSRRGLFKVVSSYGAMAVAAAPLGGLCVYAKTIADQHNSQVLHEYEKAFQKRLMDVHLFTIEIDSILKDRKSTDAQLDPAFSIIVHTPGLLISPLNKLAESSADLAGFLFATVTSDKEERLGKLSTEHEDAWRQHLKSSIIILKEAFSVAQVAFDSDAYMAQEAIGRYQSFTMIHQEAMNVVMLSYGTALALYSKEYLQSSLSIRLEDGRRIIDMVDGQPIKNWIRDHGMYIEAATSFRL